MKHLGIARSDLVSSMCDGVPLVVENKGISMVWILIFFCPLSLLQAWLPPGPRVVQVKGLC